VVAGWAIVAVVASSCAMRSASAPGVSDGGGAPSSLLGTFQDDYGIEYRITPDRWQQGARTTYLVNAWYAGEQYLIARNAPSNPSAPNLWTRIDWIQLDGMPPYRWAYCLSAYDAPTRQAAHASLVAQRDRPKTGCNGFPFSRMKSINSPTR